MWVKVCANTTLGDAQLAAAAGADALGFVFAPSGRRVGVAEVAGMTAALAVEFPGVERVGVFGAAEAEEIVSMALAAGLTGVQLHGQAQGGRALGGLDVELLRAVRVLAAGRLEVIPVLHWDVFGAGDVPGSGDVREAGEAPDIGNVQGVGEVVAGGVAVERATEAVLAGLWAVLEEGAERVLLDSKVGSATGGTGVAFGWAEAARALAEARRGLRLIVAGGLRAETVAEAARALAPWGVDVASGVEAEVGRKSPERVRAFVAAARFAAATHGGRVG